jgi:hypothetical protein
MRGSHVFNCLHVGYVSSATFRRLREVTFGNPTIDDVYHSPPNARYHFSLLSSCQGRMSASRNKHGRNNYGGPRRPARRQIHTMTIDLGGALPHIVSSCFLYRVNPADPTEGFQPFKNNPKGIMTIVWRTFSPVRLSGRRE